MDKEKVAESRFLEGKFVLIVSTINLSVVKCVKTILHNIEEKLDAINR